MTERHLKYLKMMEEKFHLPDNHYYAIHSNAFGGYDFSIRRKRKYFFPKIVENVWEHPVAFKSTEEMCMRAAERLKKNYRDNMNLRDKNLMAFRDLGR